MVIQLRYICSITDIELTLVISIVNYIYIYIYMRENEREQIIDIVECILINVIYMYVCVSVCQRVDAYMCACVSFFYIKFSSVYSYSRIKHKSTS